MEVLKVELDAITTSFRYPHFLVGKHPSYRMPPPATIYGHICSALGEWLPKDSIKFSYCFFYLGKCNDLEHIHVAKVSSRKMDNKFGYLKNIEAEVNPLSREILLFPKLILYINAKYLLNKLFDAFQCPHYPVILGRSQDLATYKKISFVKLEKSSRWYLENTLLPWSFRTRLSEGTSILMPTFINPEDRRQVEWDRYVILGHRIPCDRIIRYEDDKPQWIDPETTEIKEMKRAIIWNSFIGEETGEANFANIK